MINPHLPQAATLRCRQIKIEPEVVHRPFEFHASLRAQRFTRGRARRV